MHRPELLLHSAARLHAAEAYGKWADYYTNSGASGRPSSNESYGIFPRYLVLEAIQTAIERLDADSLPSLAETRAQLIEGIRAARSPMTDNVEANEIARAAMAEERSDMVAFLSALDDDALARVEPLPYRHVLPKPEGDRRWQLLATRWNIDASSSYWYPLAGDERPDLLAFDSGYFGRDVHADLLHRIVRILKSHRVWEFREFGLSSEIDVALLEPVYSGEEGYWCDAACNWIIYASHESSIAVGGPLLNEIKRGWPEWQQFLWKPPY